MEQRRISKIIAAHPATDGAGVKINRLPGFASPLSMDPFLMLDEIRSDSKDDFIAGFPPHPHRGFETVTYMRAGRFSHEDSMGNHGAIGEGEAQWMTAGSGVIHSEMPEAETDRMHGFQFWLNLPAAEKMQHPVYRDIHSDEITSVMHRDVRIRLIAGEISIGQQTLHGAVTGKTTQALIADVDMPPHANLALSLNEELNLQFYVYRGSVSVGGESVDRGHLAYVGEGAELALSSNAGSGLLLFGGKPIREPVVHHGPFVMNTQAEIQQAVLDYQNGVLVQR